MTRWHLSGLERMFPVCFAIAASWSAFFYAALAGELSAQQIPPAFAAILREPSHRNAVEDAMKRFAANYPAGCQSGISIGEFHFAAYQPVLTAGDGNKLLSGVWKEGFDVTACGFTRQINALNVIKDGEIKIVQTLPGTTIADPILQRDAAPALFSKRYLAGKECTSAFALNTEFKGFEGPVLGAKPGQPTRAWREEWTLWACGKEIVVPIRFTPDSTGTQWTTVSTEVRVK